MKKLKDEGKLNSTIRNHKKKMINYSKIYQDDDVVDTLNSRCVDGATK